MLAKYQWNVRNQEIRDWNVSVFEKIITQDVIAEILKDAIKNGAKDIYIDYCCLAEDDPWSEFQDIDKVYDLIHEYQNTYGIYVTFVC